MPKNNENMHATGLAENPVAEWAALVVQTSVLTAASEIQALPGDPENTDRLKEIDKQTVLLMASIDLIIKTTGKEVAGLHGYLHHALLGIVPTLITEMQLGVIESYSIVASAILHVGSSLRTQSQIMPLAPLDSVVRKLGVPISPIYTTTG
jgi:hypothetical protein